MKKRRNHDAGFDSNTDRPFAELVPMVANRPPWSTSKPSKKISRCRQHLKSPRNLSKCRGVAQKSQCSR